MFEGTLDSSIISALIKKGVISKTLHLRTSPDILFDFSEALNKAILINEFGPFVSPHSPIELRDSGAIAFLSRDKMAGVCTWPDGNIGALFHNKNSKIRPARPELLLAAISRGGCKLDCFNGTLARFYGSAGFIPVARVLFDPQYAPERWKPEWEQPDIIFWCHNGDEPLSVANKYGSYPLTGPRELAKLRLFPSYDDAYHYRDSLIPAHCPK